MNDTPAGRSRQLGQTVLVLQGGGALGAYQVGVYQALTEAGIEPDWVIGTSIGAINASIIAGSPKGERLDRLKEFWRRVEHGHAIGGPLLPAWAAAAMRNMLAVSAGIPAFFRPNPAAFVSAARAARPGGGRLLFGRAAARRRSATWSISTSSTAARSASPSAPRTCAPARCAISTAAT